MRAIIGVLLLALLLVPGTAVANEELPALALELEFSDARSGEARLRLAWPGSGTPSEAPDWPTLQAHYAADENFTLSGNYTAEVVLRYLAGPFPGGNTDEALAGAILGSGPVAEAELSKFTAEPESLVLTIDFRLAEDDALHPLMFATQLGNATGLQLSLSVKYPPDTELKTNKFVLDHLRLPSGGRLGGTSLSPVAGAAAYNPAEGEITLDKTSVWTDGRVMAIAIALQLLLIITISYRLGGGLLRPLLFWVTALLAYIFVSFPFSTMLCYGIILFGLARQYLYALEARVLARDMGGFVDALQSLSRGEARSGLTGANGRSSYQIQELDVPRNPLARLFPCKVQELFLIYDDGRLISHAALHGSQMADSEIVSSMLTAIGDFIKDSFSTDDEVGGLENLKYGNLNLLVQRKRPLYLAGVISGTPPDDFGLIMKEFLDELWDEYGYTIGATWNGDTSSLAPIADELSRFIAYWSSR